MDALSGALAMAARGWPVFPVAAKGKTPTVKFSETATTDPKAIAAELAGTDLNYGIHMGKAGLVVLDEDQAGGLDQAAAAHGTTVVATFTVQTSKGRHMYYRVPAGFVRSNTAGGFAEHGVDVRGADNAYVVGAGSTHHTGVIYTVLDDRDPVPLPAWCVTLIGTKAPTSVNPAATANPFADGAERGLAALPDVIRGPQPGKGGQRHQELLGYAASLRARRTPHAEAVELMNLAWSRCEQPPACTTEAPWSKAMKILDDTWAARPEGTSQEQARAAAELGDVEGADDGPPIPLTRSSPLPAFPVDAFPPTVAAMVKAVAHGTQTDPAMAGTSALTVLAACTGGHAQVEVRRGWREPLCLYTATVAGPGERKSAVQSAMVRPVLDVEQQLAEAGAASRLEAETLKVIALKDAERARSAASGVDGGGKAQAQADAIGAVAAAEAIQVPVIPRMVADDVTPEAAASLLAEQGGRLAIISAEGGIFDIIAGRYSKIPNMDLWLKGHAGDPIKVDRKGREPEYIPRPALTLGLMIQPTVLTEIARNPSFRGRGFLARILYALPVSKVGSRAIAPDAVTPSDQKYYEELIRDLAAGLAGWSGDPAVLMLADAAGEAVKALEERVEPSLAGNGELAALADWGAKYVGAVVRIAGLLHLVEHGPTLGVRTPISAATIEAATRIGDYYKACARNAFDQMGADEVTADACYLRDKLVGLDDEVSVRDLHRASRSRFKSRADVEPALRRLVEHDYLQRLPDPPESHTPGRRPSPRYRINHLWTERTESTQPPS